MLLLKEQDSVQNGMEELSAYEPAEQWFTETLYQFAERPDSWPTEKETKVYDLPYWVGLRSRDAVIHGVNIWMLDVYAHFGPGSQVEMEMNLVDGQEDELLAYMKQQIEKRAPKPCTYSEILCDRLREKGRDYHPSDDWW